jgi:hypothetical protein
MAPMTSQTSTNTAAMVLVLLLVLPVVIHRDYPWVTPGMPQEPRRDTGEGSGRAGRRSPAFRCSSGSVPPQKALASFEATA